MTRILAVALVLILPAGPAAADAAAAGQVSRNPAALVDGGAVPVVYVPANGAPGVLLAGSF